jgi:hypothetical protein
MSYLVKVGDSWVAATTIASILAPVEPDAASPTEPMTWEVAKLVEENFELRRRLHLVWLEVALIRSRATIATDSAKVDDDDVSRACAEWAAEVFTSLAEVLQMATEGKDHNQREHDRGRRQLITNLMNRPRREQDSDRTDGEAQP